MAVDKEQKPSNTPERDIVKEMRESYLDYAMSVIVSRALPDVRDGLKPVHRRILYTMHEMGLSSGAKYRKSAAITGDVMGKYHPHGDSAIYDSLVRMAQPWALRYPLIDGQGNFGSIDGDSAAAMRYTEAKMTPIAAEVLRDIEKETVDFIPNYDGTQQEPKVLPSALPQFLGTAEASRAWDDSLGIFGAPPGSNRYAAQVGVSQPLYSSGVVSAGIRAAGVGLSHHVVRLKRRPEKFDLPFLPEGVE